MYIIKNINMADVFIQKDGILMMYGMRRNSHLQCLMVYGAFLRRKLFILIRSSSITFYITN
jgi:hypothetical protein